MSPDTQVRRIRFRRAVTLMLMTLVIPGSAQLVAGRRDVGRIAMRVWMGTIATVLFVGFLGLVSQSFALWFFTNTFILGLLRFALIGSANELLRGHLRRFLQLP